LVKNKQNITAEPFFLISLEGSTTIKSVTDNIFELIGFKAEDFLSGKILLQKLIHPKDDDISDLLFLNELNIKSGSYNLRMRHNDGHIICLKADYKKSALGKGYTLELILKDPKALWNKRVTNKFTNGFISMMENTDDYIYFKDRNHVFTGASQTLVNLTSPSKNWRDLLGKTNYDVFAEEYADIYYDLEKQVFSGTPVAHETQETLDNSGKKGWVDNRKYPILNEEKEIIGLFGIARDITESKQIQETLLLSEKRFRTIFEESPLGVALIDSLTGHIYEVNPRFAEIAGRSLEEMASIDWMSITHPDDVQEDLDNMDALNTGKITGFKMEKRYIKPDDSHVWISMTIAPITVVDKSAPRHLCMIEDISKKKKIEDQLIKYQNNLEDEINKSTLELKKSQNRLLHSEKLSTLGKFAGTVAHEFNNPLSGVINLIDQIEAGVSEEEQYTFLKLAKKECWRMADMIKNLQSFYKPSEENFTTNKMCALIEEVLLIADKACKNKGITVHKTYKTGNYSFEGIEDQIKQVILNIIKNSIDSISGDNGKITFSIAQTSKNIMVEIQDSGSGIDKENLHFIFEPFFTTKGKEGTGLGLSVSYGIIKKHGGDILIESELGIGCTVTLVIPIKRKI